MLSRVFLILITGLLVHQQLHGANADNAGNTNVATGVGCMQDYSNISGGYECTVNEVDITNIVRVTVAPGDACTSETDTVTFTAIFELKTRGKEVTRHDVGLWFATDGDPNNDGALLGTCTVGAIPYDGADTQGGNGFVDKDEDNCGDIDSGHSPVFPSITVTAKCARASNGFLKLPYCVGWKTPGIEDTRCSAPTNTFAASPTQCTCDKTFTIPQILVPGAPVVAPAAPGLYPPPQGRLPQIAIDPTVALPVPPPSPPSQPPFGPPPPRPQQQQQPLREPDGVTSLPACESYDMTRTSECPHSLYRGDLNCKCDDNCNRPPIRKWDQCHVTGCDECRPGTWQVGGGYWCVPCTIEGCNMCQDFNGCISCSPGWKRVYDSICDYWKCQQVDPVTNCQRTRKLNQQCGGSNYSGDVCCESDLVCKYFSHWYSACNNPPVVRATSCVAQFQECGGATPCCQGTSCVMVNPYYSQCK